MNSLICQNYLCSVFIAEQLFILKDKSRVCLFFVDLIVSDQW